MESIERAYHKIFLNPKDRFFVENFVKLALRNGLELPEGGYDVIVLAKKNRHVIKNFVESYINRNILYPCGIICSMIFEEILKEEDSKWAINNLKKIKNGYPADTLLYLVLEEDEDTGNPKFKIDKKDVIDILVNIESGDPSNEAYDLFGSYFSEEESVEILKNIKVGNISSAAFRLFSESRNSNQNFMTVQSLVDIIDNDDPKNAIKEIDKYIHITSGMNDDDYENYLYHVKIICNKEDESLTETKNLMRGFVIVGGFFPNYRQDLIRKILFTGKYENYGFD